VQAADLNGDGAPDLVVGYGGSAAGSVSVLLNDGNGTFAPRADYATGAAPTRILVTDLSGDGRPDLAVVYQSGAAGGDPVSVLLNNGDGTFAPKVDYAAGSASVVAAADLNGDGRPDLIVPPTSNTSSVLFGKGGGAFAAKVDYASAPLALSLVAADLNGDGRPDIVLGGDSIFGMDVMLNACVP
jgi:hypothetical protein